MDSILQGVVDQIENDIRSLHAAKAAIIQSAKSNGNGHLAGSVTDITKVAKPRKAHKMSAAARKRIGDATRKRWALKKTKTASK